MAGFGALAIATLVQAGVSGYSSYDSHKTAKEAQAKQSEAIAKAEAKQAQSDYDAEQARLEALAKDQGNSNNRVSAFDFGDKNKKPNIVAKTISYNTTEEDNYNPFYSRGLV
jgi:hypothetical protein